MKTTKTIFILLTIIFTVNSCGEWFNAEPRLYESAPAPQYELNAYAPYDGYTRLGYLCNNDFPGVKIIENSLLFDPTDDIPDVIDIKGEWLVIDGWKFTEESTSIKHIDSLFTYANVYECSSFIWLNKPIAPRYDTISTEPFKVSLIDHAYVRDVIKKLRTTFVFDNINGYEVFYNKDNKENTLERLYKSDKSYLLSKFGSYVFDDKTRTIITIVDISADGKQILIQTANYTDNQVVDACPTSFNRILLQKL